MDFVQYLSSKEDSGISPEGLRQLGNRAASLYIQESRPLNESISDMAKESGLNLEQVRRVSEYANNATFSHMFKAGYDKNITFPMADASAVMQDKDASKIKTASPRAVLPKNAYIPGQEYVSLDAAFASEDMEKVAGLTETDRHLKALEFLDLKRESDRLDSEVKVAADNFAIKLYGLKDLCKEAATSGHTPSTIGAAIEFANPSPGLLEVIGLDFGNMVEFGCMDKLAFGGMAVMPGNPVTGLTQELEGISGKLVSAQQAMNRVQMAMTELLGILRGPAPGSAMANTVFNPGGMVSQPANVPPAGAAGIAPQGSASGGPPPSAPPPSRPSQGGPPVEAVGSPPSSSGPDAGALFGGGR